MAHLRGRSHGKAWQLLLGLTLLSLLLRFAVPAGAMIQPADNEGHTLTIALCHAVGEIYDTRVPLPDQPTSPQPAHLDATCPFCALVAQALMPGAGPPAPTVPEQVALITTPPPAHQAVARSRTGPPLGSRAPPAFPG